MNIAAINCSNYSNSSNCRRNNRVFTGRHEDMSTDTVTIPKQEFNELTAWARVGKYLTKVANDAKNGVKKAAMVGSMSAATLFPIGAGAGATTALVACSNASEDPIKETVAPIQQHLQNYLQIAGAPTTLNGSTFNHIDQISGKMVQTADVGNTEESLNLKYNSNESTNEKSVYTLTTKGNNGEGIEETGECRVELFEGTDGKDHERIYDSSNELLNEKVWEEISEHKIQVTEGDGAVFVFQKGDGLGCLLGVPQGHGYGVKTRDYTNITAVAK